MDKAKRRTKKTLVGIVGGMLLIVGVIAIPYPGPGWLIVFTALAILGTEFHWAKRILIFAKGKYDRWQEWLAAQHFAVKAFFWCMTAAVVVVTLWLLNGYGFMNKLLGFGWDWIESPLPIPGK